MSTPLSDNERIKSYLLGQLADEDESLIEAHLLTNREFYDELSIVENDLIDQFLSGALSDTDRVSFESHFLLSPERRQKVRFSRALRKHVSVNADQAKDELVLDTTEPERVITPPSSSFKFLLGKPFVTYAAAAVVLVVAGAGVFVTWRSWQSVSTGRVLAIELTPTPSVRDVGVVKQVNLASDVQTVRLQLSLPANDYPTYEVVLRDSSLRAVLTTPNLKPQIINGIATVVTDVSADLLAPGDYRVNLSGVTADSGAETIATFSFVVRR